MQRPKAHHSGHEHRRELDHRDSGDATVGERDADHVEVVDERRFVVPHVPIRNAALLYAPCDVEEQARVTPDEELKAPIDEQRARAESGERGADERANSCAHRRIKRSARSHSGATGTPASWIRTATSPVMIHASVARVVSARAATDG